VLYAIWAAAVVYSFRQYRKDRAQESADAVTAAAEANIVAQIEPGPVVDTQVPAGRPSASLD
jgi:hypothetical protein